MSLSALAYLFIYFGGALMSIVRGPIYGIFLYLYVFYANAPHRWWSSDLPSLRWSLIAGLICLASIYLHSNKLRHGREPWYSTSAAKLLILYSIWMWLQTLWAYSPDDHMYGTTLYTKYVVLYYMIYKVIDTEKKLELFCIAHVIGCCYLGWVALGEGGGRLEGVGGPGYNTSNTLAGLLCTGLIFGAMLLLRREKTLKLIAFCTLPLILNGLVLTQSRGSFVSIVVTGFFLLYLRPIVKRKEFLTYAGLGVILFFMVAHQSLFERLETLYTIGDTPQMSHREVAGEGRLYLLGKQLEMFKDHPWGVGHRGTKTLSPMYMEPQYLSKGARSSHNTYTAILVDQGFVGAILYIGIIIWFLRTTMRIKRYDAQGGSVNIGLFMTSFSGSFIVLSFAGIFTSYFRGETQIWMLALLAVTNELLKSAYGNEGGIVKKY
jgi:O-Antigen ligase